jgi:WD40 repeat protein
MDAKTLAVLVGHTDDVTAGIFNLSDERILTASWDGTLRLWDVGGYPLAVLEGHTDWVNTAVFAPGGNRILTASQDGTARLWPYYGTLKDIITEAKRRIMLILSDSECLEYFSDAFCKDSE